MIGRRAECDKLGEGKFLMKKIINSAEQMLKVTRRIDQGRGVLYTYGNAPADTPFFKQFQL